MSTPEFIEENPILKAVSDKLTAQSLKGIQKYGHTVRMDSLSLAEWINHAQEEIIDLLVYLETIKQAIKPIAEAHFTPKDEVL